jgi:hypothetical protein
MELVKDTGYRVIELRSGKLVFDSGAADREESA